MGQAALSQQIHQAKERAKLIRGSGNLGRREMCDYSLHNVKTRPAKVGDKLTTRDFGTGTRRFSASEDMNVAVCLLPGTELSFEDEIRRERFWPWSKGVISHKTAICRQIDRHGVAAHRDALEFPDVKSCC